MVYYGSWSRVEIFHSLRGRHDMEAEIGNWLVTYLLHTGSRYKHTYTQRDRRTRDRETERGKRGKRERSEVGQNWKNGCFLWQSDHTKVLVCLPVSEVGGRDGEDTIGWHRFDFLFYFSMTLKFFHNLP